MAYCTVCRNAWAQVILSAKVSRSRLAYRCTRLLVTLLILTLIAPVNAANFLTGLEAYLLENDFAAALREWRPLAEQGHAEAQFYLGRMYANGEGVAQNDSEAAKWYRRAAEQGHTEALDKLMGMAIQAAQTAYQTGSEAYLRGDFAVALREWKPLAELGHADAQHNLGFMYDLGKGVPENNAEAVKWYSKAAEQDHPEAQWNLGVMFADGEGVPENEVEAVRWFRRAAEQGYTAAQTSLGFMYAIGKGLPQDDVQAHAWFNIAAAQGDPHAEKMKDQIADSMSLQGLTRAQELAQQYWETYVLPFVN